MNQLTNREWLNSLSNEHFRDFFLSYLNVKVKTTLDDGQILEFVTKASYQKIIRSNIQSDIGFLTWLEQPCMYIEIVEDSDIVFNPTYDFYGGNTE